MASAKRYYFKELFGSDETISVMPVGETEPVEIDYGEARRIWMLYERRYVGEELANRLEEADQEAGFYEEWVPIRQDLEDGRFPVEQLLDDLFEWHCDRVTFDTDFDHEAASIRNGYFQ